VRHTSRRRQVRAAALLAAAATLLTACGGGDAPSPGTPSGSGSPSASATTSAPAVAKVVLDEDFPDPDVLKVGDTYYAYATQKPGPLRNLQMATSTDLVTWEVVDADPLPQLPAWANPGRTWAPEVSAVPGGFAMYFTARNASPDLQCIGVATATKPTGPFKPVGTKPLICPADQGGAIDAAMFVDTDGSRHLLWKNDGNCCGKDTWLQIQPLSPDGLRLTGPAKRLIKQDQPWEGNLVEAPTLIRRDTGYALLYSANDYSGDKYATGYATAKTLNGPWTKSEEPLLSSEDTGTIGPGGQDVVEAPDGSQQLVFHGWDAAITKRSMYLAPLTWRGTEPVVGP